MSSSISGMHSYHTGCETFNLTSRLTEVLTKLDDSKSDPLLGGLGARVAGVIVTPLTSLIDAIWHATVFVVKMVTGAVVSPYNFFARLVHPKHALPENLELSSAFVHLKRSAEYLLNVVTLPVLSAMSPGKAHGFVNHGFAEKQADTVIRNLSKEKADLNTTVDGQKTEITELKNNNTTLESEKTKLENEKTTLENENNAMSTTVSRVSQLEQEILNLKNTNSQLGNEKTALQGEFDQQKATISDLQNENNNTITERDEFKEMIDRKEFRITQQEIEIWGLQMKLQNKITPFEKKFTAVLDALNHQKFQMEVKNGKEVVASCNGGLKECIVQLDSEIESGGRIVLTPTKNKTASNSKFKMPFVSPGGKSFELEDVNPKDGTDAEDLQKIFLSEIGDVEEMM